jgi:hypothetical protein
MVGRRHAAPDTATKLETTLAAGGLYKGWDALFQRRHFFASVVPASTKVTPLCQIL